MGKEVEQMRRGMSRAAKRECGRCGCKRQGRNRRAKALGGVVGRIKNGGPTFCEGAWCRCADRTITRASEASLFFFGLD